MKIVWESVGWTWSDAIWVLRWPISCENKTIALTMQHRHPSSVSMHRGNARQAQADRGGRATFSSSTRLLYSSPAFHFRQCECWELWGGAISSVADTRTAELPHRYSNPPLPPHPPIQDWSIAGWKMQTVHNITLSADIYRAVRPLPRKIRCAPNANESRMPTSHLVKIMLLRIQSAE